MTATKPPVEFGQRISEDDLIEGYAQDVPGTTLVHAPPAALFKTDDPVEVVQQATTVADALADVIRSKRLFSSIQGREHVKVEGWQLLGVMLGVTAVCVATEPVDGGYKATVEARTSDGRVIGRADALCTKAENTWRNRDDYARLSMAQTRATSKALKGPLGFIVSLAGYQTTPAEEVPFAQSEAEAEASAPAVQEFVTAKDIEALQAAAKGLSAQQIKLAMGASGVPIPDPFVWNRVPKDKAAALALKLSETAR